MKELLDTLLENDILSEDTTTQLKEAFDQQLKEAKENAEKDVEAKLTTRWISERDQLIEALDQKTGDVIADEIEELRADIANFRDLEAESAAKLVESKKELSKQLDADLSELVENLSVFLEERLTLEMTELKEDIEEAKKRDFGMRIFEAVADEFSTNFINRDKLLSDLSETRKELQLVKENLTFSENARKTAQRREKMETVLKPLSGQTREVMEAILEKVDTDQLQEGYDRYIGSVLSEVNENSENENTQVIAESTDVNQATETNSGRVVTGDRMITESKNDNPALDDLRKLAGIS